MCHLKQDVGLTKHFSLKKVGLETHILPSFFCNDLIHWHQSIWRKIKWNRTNASTQLRRHKKLIDAGDEIKLKNSSLRKWNLNRFMFVFHWNGNVHRMTCLFQRGGCIIFLSFFLYYSFKSIAYKHRVTHSLSTPIEFFFSKIHCSYYKLYMYCFES